MDVTDLQIRPIEPGDAPRLGRLLTRLSVDTIYRRFFQASVRPRPQDLAYLATVDHHEREALVALDGDEVVGVARYDFDVRTGGYEVAVVVEDAWQHHGVGRLLVNELSRRARREGITEFRATFLAENEPVRQMIRSLNPNAHFSGWGSEREVALPLTRTA